MDRVRLAIVGCGSISSLNAAGYLEHEACDVVALCDPDLERCRRRAREWGLEPKLYRRYDEVLADPDVDAVELLTPTHLHAAQSVAALEAGKHVSCQKPMAATVAEAERARGGGGSRRHGLPGYRELPLLSADSQGERAARRRRHRRAVAAANTDRPRPPHRRPRGAPDRDGRPRVAPGRRGEPRRVAVRRRLAQVRHRDVVARRSGAGLRDGDQDGRLSDRRARGRHMEVPGEKLPGRLRLRLHGGDADEVEVLSASTSSSRSRAPGARSG